MKKNTYIFETKEKKPFSAAFGKSRTVRLSLMVYV